MIMKRTLTALTLAASMFANGASAFDTVDLQKLKDTGDCMGCDLEGANLREWPLMYANMSKADLTGADLKGAFMRGANMKGAILCNTIMPDGSVIYSGC